MAATFFSSPPEGSVLAQLPPAARQVFLLVGLAAAIALGVASVLWLQQPNFSPLYSGLGDRDVADIAAALDASQVPYRVDPATGAIMVPGDRKHAVRMELATAGLPHGTGFGIEEIPNVGGFGQSPFIENALYVHAVETELARTIGALAPVEAARVHLALPPQSAFLRRRGEASASVMLRLYAGRRLDRGQAEAVVHLVASSVPGLEPGRVTVVDQTGALLSSLGQDSASGLTTSQFEYARRVEESLAERIENLLIPVLGAGRVRASVAADFDFTQTEQTRESFDPQQTAIRSEQTTEERRSGSAVAQGIPGALSNQPPETPAVDTPALAALAALAGGVGEGATNTSRSALRNFEVDKTVSHTKQAVGAVQRLSVAVLVDNKPSTLGGGAGEPLAQPELDSLTELIKQAVGFNAIRGDTISVLNSAFQAPLPVTMPEPVSWLQQPMLWDMARQGLVAVLVLVLAMVVVRPIMRHLTTPQPALLGPGPGGPGSAAGGPVTVALPAGHTERVAAARSIANQDPRQVAQVVSNWVTEGNG